MTLATKCTCGKSGFYCAGHKDCPKAVKSLDTFLIENNCTEVERNQVKAFLFILRNPDINMDALMNVIKKYELIIFTRPFQRIEK